MLRRLYCPGEELARQLTLDVIPKPELQDQRRQGSINAVPG